MEKSNKEKKKRPLTLKQRKFAKYFAETGVQTESALRAGYSADSAHSIGTENVQKPAIVNEVARLLVKSGLDLDTISSLHARNAKQSEHLPTSQKAVELAYRLHGIKDTQDEKSTKIAFIIQE